MLLKFICLTLFILQISCGITQQNNYVPAYIDESVDPCDNFYKFSCGNFEKINPRPDNELLWDNFKILQAKINNITIDILRSHVRLNDAKASKKAKDMYYACTHPSLAAEQTILPLKKAFDEIGGWPLVSEKHGDFSWDFLAEIIAEFGFPIVFNWQISPYYVDPSVYMLAISKDLLQLPSNANSDLDDFPKDLHQNVYQNHPYYMEYLIEVAKKFIRQDHVPIYEEKIQKGTERVYEILNTIKALSEDDSDMSEEEYGAIYTVQDLQEWTDTFQINFSKKINWISFLSKVFQKSGVKITEDTYINVSEQYVIKTLLTLVENTSDYDILNFIFARLVTYTAQDTNMEMWNLFNDLYKNLNMTVYTRDEYCRRKVISYPGIGLSLAVAHEYQNYNFDLRKILQPEEMIENLLDSFYELIEENSWLDDDVRHWVRNKAENMVKLVAFPENVYDADQLDDYYSDLEICSHDHYGNSQRIRAFNFAKNSEILDKERRRDIWNQSPLIVNAFYNPNNNRIVFPVGIMDYPFFTGTSKLVDYSRIGVLIGHEITHGFDSNGRNMDANGSYVQNDWSEQVLEAFNNRSKCFIEQYNQYIIEELNVTVNGALTNAENIADNGGIREAFRAFEKLSTNLPKMGKYTPEQLFFISYAEMWCRVDTEKSLEIMQEHDNHPPNRFRVIGTLSNMEEFARAFNCPLNSPMNPAKKCVLW